MKDRLNRKRVARQYFNLYSEEYWLDKQNLIPEEMLKNRIDKGVIVNLKEYSFLVEEYKCWVKKGAHNHPEDFQEYVSRNILSVLSESEPPSACN